MTTIDSGQENYNDNVFMPPRSYRNTSLIKNHKEMEENEYESEDEEEVPTIKMLLFYMKLKQENKEITLLEARKYTAEMVINFMKEWIKTGAIEGIY